MDYQGKLIVKNETETISEKFKKRSFVIESDEQYSQQVIFQLTQDKCSLLDSFNEGEVIKVTFSLQGKRFEKEGKVNYFNNLNAYKLEKVGDDNF